MVMPHPLEATIRDAYAAFGRGDGHVFASCCAEDFVLTVPGHCLLTGIYGGPGGLEEFARKIEGIAGQTFRDEVEHVLANDRHAFVLARHRFVREGRPREYQTLHAYLIRDGRLARCWEHPCDLAAFDEAWGEAEGAGAQGGGSAG